MSDQLLQIDLADPTLLRAVSQALALMANPHSLMDAIGAKIEANVNLRFDTKTDPTGAPWAPLSTSDNAKYWQARNFPDGLPGSLLERTRMLRNSLAHNAGDDWVDIGTSRSVPGKSRPSWQVGMLHEFGTKTMPRRGLLTADPETGTLGQGDQADILAIIEQAINGAFE